MKYVRNIEDLKKYTFEFFDAFLPQALSDQLVNYFLLNMGDGKLLEGQAIAYLSQRKIPEDTVAEYGEAILQLNDYRGLLKKFVELLLKARCYEGLSAFLNRIFLQQVGDVKYRSIKRQYSINERYFDRFIEIISYCQIDKKLYMPFFLAIFASDANSRMFAYKEPLKEYLDVFLKEGEDDEFISQLIDLENKDGIEEYASSNIFKTIKAIVMEYVTGENGSAVLAKRAIAMHKTEGINILNEILSGNDEGQKQKAVSLLCSLKSDRRVKDKLKNIYETTGNPRIKAILEKECGFDTLKMFETEQEFLNEVNEKVDQIQERLYGVRLKRFYDKNGLVNTDISGKVLTYIMEVFKSREIDSNLSAYREYFKFVDTKVLQGLSNVVWEVAYSRGKFLSSKWAMRLIAVFAPMSLIKEITECLKVWFFDKNLYAGCKYFVDMMASGGHEGIIYVVRELQKENLTPKQKKYFEQKLENFSDRSSQSIEEVKDKLADTFGFDKDGYLELDIGNRILLAKINLDCTISIYNSATGKPARLKGNEQCQGENVKKYLKQLEKEVKEQRKRLWNSFMEFREYDLATFRKCIVNNCLLNFLAKHLYWGKYKKGKLCEVCLFQEDRLVHEAGNVLDDLDNYNVAILQPLDAEQYAGRLSGRIQTLFDQLNFPHFQAEENIANCNYVDVLSGVVCNAQLFVTRLEKLKFKVADLDNRGTFGTLFKVNKNLNLITTVEFERIPMAYQNCGTALGKIRFYDLSKQTKNGKAYALNKSEALTIKDINEYVLSNEIGQIIKASKN